MWPPVVFLVIAIIAVGFLALVAMVLTGKRGHKFNVEEYQTRWLKIDNGLTKDSPQSYGMAVIQADKLLDKALLELGLPGKTMADRLKKMENQFSNMKKIWQAHRLRNQIAHEPDFEVSYDQASQALAIFKQALKEIGAI